MRIGEALRPFGALAVSVGHEDSTARCAVKEQGFNLLGHSAINSFRSGVIAGWLHGPRMCVRGRRSPGRATNS